MKGKVGVWIDHNQAVLVRLEGELTTLCRLPSQVERVPEEGTERWGAHAHGTGARVREKRRDARYRQKLRRFYQDIIDEVNDADWVIICGPGQARIELLTEMKITGANLEHLLGDARLPQMSENQLVAWFREAFHQGPERVLPQGQV